MLGIGGGMYSSGRCQPEMAGWRTQQHARQYKISALAPEGRMGTCAYGPRAASVPGGCNSMRSISSGRPQPSGAMPMRERRAVPRYGLPCLVSVCLDQAAHGRGVRIFSPFRWHRSACYRFIDRGRKGRWGLRALYRGLPRRVFLAISVINASLGYVGHDRTPTSHRTYDTGTISGRPTDDGGRTAERNEA